MCRRKRKDVRLLSRIKFRRLGRIVRGLSILVRWDKGRRRSILFREFVGRNEVVFKLMVCICRLDGVEGLFRM